MPHKTPPPAARPIDWLIFVLAAVFFASNIVFGRGISADVAPFITAFLRWSGAALLLLPFVFADRRACFIFLRQHPLLWLLLGFLGMGVCGGGVYWSLQFTTASNATLIYTTSSLFIIILEWMFRGRAIGLREMAGMGIAFIGIAVIVLKGEWQAALHFRFNPGDFGILAAAIAWAAYSLLLRHKAVTSMAPLASFGMVGLAGALVLAPFALIEFINGGARPDTADDWVRIAAIIVFASLAAFASFQHAVRVFGPSLAGVALYLMPPFSIVMAAMFLGERFESYHAAGIALVMGGVVLATAPIGVKKRAIRDVS